MSLKNNILKTKVVYKLLRNNWEEIYRRTPLKEIPWYNSKPEKSIVKIVKDKLIPTNGKVLDLGSGPAVNSIYLAEKGFNVLGIDISRTPVDAANKICKERNISCRYEIRNVLNYKSREKFDFIFDRGCFHHLNHKQKLGYISVIHSHIKNEGKIFLQTFSDKNLLPWRVISKKKLHKYFSEKFDIKSIKDAIHTEPDGRKVYLYEVIMEKR